MALLIDDNLTEASSTAISSHTESGTGGGWIDFDSTSLVCDTGGATGDDSTTQEYAYNDVSLSDYDLDIVFDYDETVGGSASEKNAGVVLFNTLDTALDTYRIEQSRVSSPDGIYIRRHINGSGTALANGTANSFTTNTITVTVRPGESTTVDVNDDGGDVCSTTDTTYSTFTRVGINARARDHISALTVNDSTVGGSTTPHGVFGLPLHGPFAGPLG